MFTYKAFRPDMTGSCGRKYAPGTRTVSERFDPAWARRDGCGLAVCANPLHCWDWVPYTTHTRLWRVEAEGPLRPGHAGVWFCGALTPLREIPRDEWAFFTDEGHLALTGRQSGRAGEGDTCYLFDDATLSAGGGFVHARDRSRFYLYGSAAVQAHDDARGVAGGRGYAVASGRSYIEAIDDARVIRVAPAAVLDLADSPEIAYDGRYARTDVVLEASYAEFIRGVVAPHFFDAAPGEPLPGGAPPGDAPGRPVPDGGPEPAGPRGPVDEDAVLASWGG